MGAVLRIKMTAASRATIGLCLVGALIAMMQSASAATVYPACDASCGWSVSVDGVQVGSGGYPTNADGSISVNNPFRWSSGDGSYVSIDSMNGNLDPVLGFSVSAGTASAGKTFSFTFSMPISLAGQINANSQIGYTLTSTTAAGAQIAPLLGHVLTAQEVDTSVGGLPALNKGVDAGDIFFFVGGPTTLSSGTYSAGNTFTGNAAYDLMSLTVAFSLSANSNVGMSGFVQQEPVPLPAALPLLISGLLGVVGLRRRTSKQLS